METGQAPRAAELMRTAFEGLAARDPDRVTAISDEQTYNDFVVLGPVVGKTNIRAFFVELFAAVPDLQFEVVRILDAGENTAIGEWRIRGTFSGGSFQGIDPTGRAVDLRGVDIMEFEHSTLRRNTIFYDGLSFARQIGLLPSEGSRVDRAMMAGFNGVTRLKRVARR